MAERVLLTGISGYIGQHCGAELLNQGFEVVGTVRSLSKADATRSAIAAVAPVERLTFVEADLLSDQGWDEAVAALKSINPGFPGLAEADWLAFARRVYREVEGKPRADYDPALAVTFPSAEDITAGKVPELWPLFDMLAALPCLVLRGAYSDLLSERTVAEMQARHPRLAAATIALRGHVPFLDEADSRAAITGWLAAVDSASARPAPPAGSPAGTAPAA